MSSVLDVLRGGASVAGAGFHGFAEDQQNKVAQALRAKQEARLAENDSVLNTIRGRQPLTTVAGPGGRPVRGPDVEGAEVYVPPEPAPRIPNTTVVGAGGLPERGPDVPGAKVYVPPVRPEKSTAGDLTPTIGPDGTPVWGPKVAGGKIPGASSTPRMARAPTEGQEKSYIYHGLMENAEPEIDKAMKSGKVRPAAISTFLTTSKIPLSGGILASMVNAGLNAEEQTLLRAGADFTAGVKRKESGAAVSNPEIAEVFGRYFPGIFGDTPELTQSKNDARKAYREMMRRSASPASEYYSQVEKQGNPEIDPAVEAGDPGGGNVAPVRKAAGGTVSRGTPALGSRALAESHLRAQGKTAQQILLILGPP